MAREQGLDAAVIEAIAAGTAPPLASPEENAVYDFCRELHGNHAVADDSYTQAVEMLGREGVIELTVLSGYYTLISMILNTFEIAPPDGAAPPLGPASGM